MSAIHYDDQHILIEMPDDSDYRFFGSPTRSLKRLDAVTMQP